jgi:hypothetical protein
VEVKREDYLVLLEKALAAQAEFSRLEPKRGAGRETFSGAEAIRLAGGPLPD